MTAAPQTLRIGTRGSPLALAQAALVRDRLAAVHPHAPAAEIVVIRTTGDAVIDRPLAELGGKGLFTKEIDAALAERRVDIAVHSLKDVETRLPDGLALDCFLPRADPRDVLIGAPSIDALPAGARVGTSSLRRGAQIRAHRPDVSIVPFRGNVDTRIARLAAGEAEATLLARAGLDRLGRDVAIGATLEPEEFLPAVGQGIIAIARRAGDGAAADWVAPLNDAAAAAAALAERAMLEVLDGSCRTPIAGLARVDGGRIALAGLVARPDGSRLYRAAGDGATGDAVAVGRSVGERLRRLAGPDFFAGFA
jgi:hydroxymethylbilane synthase